MAENGIRPFTSVDVDTAVRYYQRCCELSPAAAASLGWCLQLGRGIPIDFITAAECFKKAADSNDPDGINSFGCCLERGQGVDLDIDRAVSHYRTAASISHPDAQYNFGRCLEYGRGIGKDPARAGKFYRLAAENKNAAGQNSFGICLERGIGAPKNFSLAALFYRRAADQGHPDGANNFAFCLEHARGVEQDVELAARYYKFAADRGHPEAKLNYARCLRLLGRWEPPDRSSDSVSHPPSADRLCGLFRDFLQSPAPADSDERRLFLSLQRLKTRVPAIPAAPDAAWISQEIAGADSCAVKFALDSTGDFVAVKSSKISKSAKLIRGEAAILQSLRHPLILALRGGIAENSGGNAAITAEFAWNGALAGRFGSVELDRRSSSGANRIAMIATGIALAMRFVHSCGVTHRDLKPENVLLDRDWTVRIAGFARSASRDAQPLEPADVRIDSPYLAPECYENTFRQASDVFAFGLILYRLLAGRPAFAEDLPLQKVAYAVAIVDVRPEIPDFVCPASRELITDCWEKEPDNRPSFGEIADRLAEMEFKVIGDVNSVKVGEFVKKIEAWEKSRASE
jgi:TPR repeat protein/serine/threonine protein kinase